MQLLIEEMSINLDQANIKHGQVGLLKYVNDL